MSEQRVRDDTTCPLCGGRKDVGLVACWPCHRTQKRENAGGYSAVAEAMIEARENRLAGSRPS